MIKLSLMECILLKQIETYFNKALGLQREIYSPIELIYMINCMEDYIFWLVVDDNVILCYLC